MIDDDFLDNYAALHNAGSLFPDPNRQLIMHVMLYLSANRRAIP